MLFNMEAARTATASTFGVVAKYALFVIAVVAYIGAVTLGLGTAAGFLTHTLGVPIQVAGLFFVILTIGNLILTLIWLGNYFDNVSEIKRKRKEEEERLLREEELRLREEARRGFRKS